jgi:hypothetical protein
MNQLRSPAAQLDQAHPRKRDVATRWRKLLEDQRASGRRLMVRRGFDRQLLADVIRTLESLA